MKKTHSSARSGYFYRERKKLRFAVAILLSFTLIPFTEGAFSDVTPSTQNYDAILYAQTNNIVSGYADGTFKPQNHINRAEFTKIIVAAQLNYNPSQDPSGFDIFSLSGIHFSDLQSGVWYIPYLRRAVEKQFISGYPDGTFKPSNDISFAEAAKIIVKAFGYDAQSAGELNSATPTPNSPVPIWYKPYVDILAEHKAIPPSILSFDYKISRGQMVEIIYRLKTNNTNKPSLNYDILNATPAPPPLDPNDPPPVSQNPSQQNSNPPTVGSCQIFPSDNPWNKDISKDPLDPNSANYINSIGSGKFLHPDFGGNGEYGIPYNIVDKNQPLVPVNITDYPEESDPGPYPIPPDAKIEGGSDAHVITVDKGNCMLYELFAASKNGTGWSASGAAKFNLKSNALRPDGWTSADAAGLPIFPGLVRYDEVSTTYSAGTSTTSEASSTGGINHALRFTVRNTQKAYIHPATHYASSSTDTNRPPMGLRLRLKANFDTSKYTGAAKIILEALKKYGMIVADNGSDWFITGAADPRWDDDELGQLKKIPGSAFEVVQSGPILK